ncbi:MAG: type VI secretion system baseplate subunit TssK [Gammaproteobacteria bacterium]
MSNNNKVIWSEGMFLRPHHFQQLARYSENYMDQRCVVLRPFAWGFSDLQLDQQLLGLGKIAITRASGIFPDGTPFCIPDDDEPPLALDVPDNVHESEVFLSLPLRRSGGLEVGGSDDPEALARYSPLEYETQDSSTIGGGQASVQIGKLRVRLLLADDHRDEYACLGIARIVEMRIDKSVLLDEYYMPSTVDCQAVTGLSGFIKELHGLLKHRAEALAGRVAVSGRGGAADIADFLLLQVVNRYQPLIAHLSTLRTYHPEEFYRLAIGLSGELATFTSNDKRAPEFPPYRHDDLKSSFMPVFDVLRQSLSMVLEQSAVEIPLQERKYGIRVATVADRSSLDHASFILAVSADIPTEELRKRIPAQIKIGPVEQIRQLVNVQLPGIRIRPIPVAPRQIPFHTGFVYFELDRSNELWQQLKTSGGFAFHLGGEFPGIQMEFWSIKG